MSLRPIPKTVFRCYKTSGGKTLIETPIRLDSAGLEPSNMLVIQDADITVQQKSACFPKDSADITAKYEIMAVLGVLELSLGKYLLAVATRVLVATIQSHKVWKITSGIIIPLGKSSASPEAMDDLDLAKYAYDKGLLASVSKLMSDGFMYYSTSYDLTHSLQHNSLLNAKGLATVVDDRYYFNNFVQSTLTKASLSDKSVSDWITKTIFGFVGSTDMDCTFITTGIEKAKAYRVILISRINRKRLGARYVRRGLDLNGNAANNVEMEQIVFSLDVLKEKAISSFCQIRGSAPSIWGQELDLSYRPKLHLADPNKDEVWSSTKKHFDDLKHQYIGEKSVPGTDKGGVVCVNLLDDIGFEKPLTDIFEKSVKRFNDSKLIYESFPVTKWCKKMNYKNMDILMDRVRVNVLNSGWLLADGDIPTLNTADKLRCSRIQTGVVRVSCLDSLDRTNLTCSMFAKYVLPYQIQGISADLPAVQVLASTGVAPHEARDPAASVRLALADSLPSLVNLWADSGDAVSILYAGTCALKGGNVYLT